MLQTFFDTFRQLCCNLRRRIDKNDAEFIATESDGIITFTNRLFNRLS